MRETPNLRARILPALLLAIPLLLTGAVTPASASVAETPLTGAEVRSLIVGNTLTGGFQANPMTIVYYADGVVRGAIGLTGSDSGTWSIKGDVYCHQWVTYFSGVERCYRWYRTPNGYRLHNVDAFKGLDIEGRIEKGMPQGY